MFTNSISNVNYTLIATSHRGQWIIAEIIFHIVMSSKAVVYIYILHLCPVSGPCLDGLLATSDFRTNCDDVINQQRYPRCNKNSYFLYCRCWSRTGYYDVCRYETWLCAVWLHLTDKNDLHPLWAHVSCGIKSASPGFRWVCYFQRREHAPR